jgi:(p)ppGpp synthase/HD superfamily hydrolase
VAEIAQTNLQLYRQLLQREWDESALQLVAEAYQLAVVLFTARFRPSRKPFVCHLVGTASVVAAQGARAEIVVAALLHAAYDQGDWGDGAKGATPGRRKVLRRVIGKESEAVVHRYTATTWNPVSINDLLPIVDELADLDRNVIVLRLANEVDDMSDLGLRLSAKGDQALHQPDCVGAMEALATALGHHDLAWLIRLVYEENCALTVTHGLGSDRVNSVTELPRSAIRRPWVRLRAAITRGADRLSRLR